jgi:hypothetical protein
LSCSAGSGCACEKAGEEGAVIPLDASGEDDGGERRFVGGMLVGSSQANRRVMSHHIAHLEESRCRWKKVGCGCLVEGKTFVIRHVNFLFRPYRAPSATQTAMMHG